MSTQKCKTKVSGGKLHIELAATKVVSKHEDEIELILGVLGHPEGLVTDESRLSDFSCDAEAIERLKRASGKSFGTKAKVIDVAKAIRQSMKSRGRKTRRGMHDEY